MKTKLVIFATIFYLQLVICSISSAQISIAASATAPGNGAGLDVYFSDKGVLIPRVTLSGTGDASTISVPATGLIVYNTTVAGSTPTDVGVGFYLWNGTKWIPIIGSGTNTGDMRYWDGAKWVMVTIGAAGKYLTLSASGIPTWGAVLDFYGGGSVSDVDGNTYNTVKIGSQTWMRENLKTTKYNDGTPIPNVTLAGDWAALATGAYCDYNNDPAKSITYGRLYNWFAVTDAHGICPTGWHLPAETEWQTLISYLGGAGEAGGKLREPGVDHWYDPTQIGTYTNQYPSNSSGFTALGSSLRLDDGSFTFLDIDLLKIYTIWWESDDPPSANTVAVVPNLPIIGGPYLYFNFPLTKKTGCSVRCLKN